MLDYAFLDKCTDSDLIRAIVRKLKSGEEGYYPDLVKVRTGQIGDHDFRSFKAASYYCNRTWGLTVAYPPNESTLSSEVVVVVLVVVVVALTSPRTHAELNLFSCEDSLWYRSRVGFVVTVQRYLVQQVCKDNYCNTPYIILRSTKYLVVFGTKCFVLEVQYKGEYDNMHSVDRGSCKTAKQYSLD